ncbi:hypothetical protein [Pseudomonas aeruginosa]|uniref:hypothetical protein n=1 Tax=Pseudomonas aeruginosa TaxID=287 RepID=UPI001F1E5E3E|nr:hypothetical protein [Pseudomonas aeruginosa]
MSSIQLIEQCVTRLRGIIEALDNIHDTSPQRWSTDLDDVHSSAESLLALINDQAPAPCIDCKGTGFCNSISGEEIRCPCRAPIQFADPAQSPVEQFEQAPPSEDQLIAAGLSYPLAKEDAVKLWYSGFRSEVITVLEAWEAIGHDTGINPDKEELLESLRNMAAICNAHGNDMPAQSAIDQRQVIADAITGALAFGAQASQPPAADHWLRPFYDIGRAEGQRTQELSMLVRMLASALKRHAPDSNLVAHAANYLTAKGLAGTPLRDPPAPVEQAGANVGHGHVFPRADGVKMRCGGPALCSECAADAYRARAALAQPSPKCATCNDSGQIVVSGPHYQGEFQPPEYETEPCDMCAQPSPAQAEQAEAERPEMSPERAAYFMRRFKSEEKLLGPNEQAAVDYVLSLLAQHESIVGALRAELESERNRVNIYVNNNGIRQDNERLRAELRAALARVAELEGKLTDWVHEGFRLNEALAVAKAQHSVPEVSGIGRDTGHPRAVVLYLSKAPTDDDLRAIHDALRSLAAAPGNSVPQAWLDVQAERRRQITAEGWTPEHDDEHSHGQIARAAACYALAGSSAPNDGTAALLVSLAWPWDEQWWKPSTARRDMVKACALGLAEIERLDRAAATQGGPRDA